MFIRQKKMVLVLALLSILVFGALYGRADASIIFFDDFESYDVGTFPSSGGWTIVYGGAGNAEQYIDNTHSASGQKSFRSMGGSSCSAASLSKALSIPSRIRLEAKVFVDHFASGGCSIYNAILGLWKDNDSMWAGNIFFGSDGNIYATTQTGGATVRLTSYSAGQWYNVRVDYDYSAKKFNVYIDGSLVGQDIPILDDLTNKMPNAVRVGAGHGYYPVAWFDDVRVTDLSTAEYYYVSPSGSGTECSQTNPCDFQQALNLAANDGVDSTIYVAPGTYNMTSPFTYSKPDGDGSLTIQAQDLSNPPVLDGTSVRIDNDNNDNGAGGAGKDIIIRGITFQNSNVEPFEGGGLYIRAGEANVTIENCIFTRNTAWWGGGTYVKTSSGKVILRNNNFLRNSTTWRRGGGAYVNTASGEVVITNNTFSENYAYDAGGGVAAETHSGAITITNNTFLGNSNGVYSWISTGTLTVNNNTFTNNGNGLYVINYDSGVVIVSNNTFMQNSPDSGAYIWESSGTMTLINNIFVGNSNSYEAGGAQLVTASSGTINLINNTFTANTGYNQGGVVIIAVSDDAVLNIYNNIIWGNTAGPFPYHTNDLSVWTISGATFCPTINLHNSNLGPNSDFETGQSKDLSITCTTNYFQSGNIKEDPLFADAANGDFHLQIGSPCIDAGNNSVPGGLSTTDFEGDSRIINGTVDIGADEFNPVNLIVTKSDTGSGTVNATGCTLSWVGNYGTCVASRGTQITLTATADAGSTFVGWSGGTGSISCTGTGDCTFTITEDSGITATFTLNQYAVTANAIGTGSGSISSNPSGISYSYPAASTGSANFDYGTNIVLTATADTGSTVSWTTCDGTTSGNGTSTATCTFSNLDGAKTATATFTLNQYTITTSSNPPEGGSVICSPNPVNHGSTSTCTITTNPGYTLSGVSGTCGGTLNGDTYTTNPITADCEVIADFVLKTFTLTINRAGNGSGTVTSDILGIDCGLDCSEVYDYGTTITLTATPDAGSTFVGWSGDADCADGVVTMDGDKSCTATFALNQYAVIANATGDGSGSISSNPSGISYSYPTASTGSANFDYGTDVVLTATADSGSTVSWTTCDGTTSGNGTTTATCTFSNLDGAKTAEATFALNQYTVTVTKSGSGTGTVDATGCSLSWSGNVGTCTASYGTSITLTATADSGSTFAGWSNGTGSISCTGTDNCIFTITADSGVIATFLSDIPLEDASSDAVSEDTTPDVISADTTTDIIIQDASTDAIITDTSSDTVTTDTLSDVISVDTSIDVTKIDVSRSSSEESTGCGCTLME